MFGRVFTNIILRISKEAQPTGVSDVEEPELLFRLPNKKLLSPKMQLKRGVWLNLKKMQ